MRLLIIKLSTLFFLACVSVLLVDTVYRTVWQLEYQWPENLWISPAIDQPYQLVKLGNSHSEDGIDFKKFNTKTLDLAGVAQRFEFDLALLKQHRKQIAPGAVVIISVSPISFSHTSENSLKGFQAGYYGRVSPLLIPNLSWGDYIESEFFPFFRSGYQWRQKQQAVIKERVSNEEKLLHTSPQGISLRLAQGSSQDALIEKKVLAIDPSEYNYAVEIIHQELAQPSKGEIKPESVHFMFNKWYHTDEFSPEFFETNRSDLEALIKYCLENDWKPVLVTIPISSKLQEGLLDDYMQVYLHDNMAKTNLYGVEYLDYSSDTRLTNNESLYSNSDHFNAKGAAIFSYLLLKDLQAKGYLSPDVDGYYYGPLYKTEIVSPESQL